MAGIAPLSGSPTTTDVPGASATVPGTIQSAPPQQPPQPPAQAANFTAFPSSYDGFGQNGTQFGQLGLVNGKLSVTTTPAGGLPPAQAALDNAGTTDHAAEAQQTADAKAPPPAPLPPPPPVQKDDNAEQPQSAQPEQPEQPYTAIPNASVPNLEQTNEPGDISSGTSSEKTLGQIDLETRSAQGSQNGVQAAGQPNPPGANSGALPGTSASAPAPPAGFLGEAANNVIPGATPVENNPELGLLGAPATNPIVIQAEQQQAQASEQAAAEANAQAAAEAAARTQIQQLDFRIAAARADNNEAAVAQLQPKVVQLNGDLQGQTFAGVGTSPPQPFARPEIPPAFLNVAS